MRLSRVIAIAALLLATLMGTRTAQADTLTEAELARLSAGEVVRRELTFDMPLGHYIGGVSYVIIQAPPSEVMRALSDVNAYREILPMTLEAKEIGRKGNDKVVMLRHGGRLATAEYACRIRRESDRLVRFWLDPAHPHDLDDAWGYFRLDPVGKGATMLVYGAVVNLGNGLASMFFEEKIRGYALSTPALVRRYVEERRPAIAKQAQLNP